jgi:hypothetical protein
MGPWRKFAKAKSDRPEPQPAGPVQISHAEVSAKGGRARTAAKREAVLRNLEKAKAAREARRAKATSAEGEFPRAIS